METAITTNITHANTMYYIIKGGTEDDGCLQIQLYLETSEEPAASYGNHNG